MFLQNIPNINKQYIFISIFSAFNSTRDWSRKPKNYKKNNASMPVKAEKTENEKNENDNVEEEEEFTTVKNKVFIF